MTKSEFLNLVSKVNETGEDEFKADYNSPELMWDKVISKMKEPTKIGIIGHGAGKMAQALAAKNPDIVTQLGDFLELNPFGLSSIPIKNYYTDLPPISVLSSESYPQKRNSRFTPKKKKRKKRNK